MSTKNRKVVVVKDREPIARAMADWFWMHREATLIPNESIKTALQAVRKEAGVYERTDDAHARRAVVDARKELELRKEATLICVRGFGYRVGLKGTEDTTLYGIGWFRRTLSAADRTMRLLPLIGQEHVPAALDKVFGKARHEIRDAAAMKSSFISALRQVRKERKEIGDGKVQGK